MRVQRDELECDACAKRVDLDTPEGLTHAQAWLAVRTVGSSQTEYIEHLRQQGHEVTTIIDMPEVVNVRGDYCSVVCAIEGLTAAAVLLEVSDQPRASGLKPEHVAETPEVEWPTN
jgi:hypothetical protein